MMKICPTHIFGIYAKNATFWMLKVKFWKSLEKVDFVPYPPTSTKSLKISISGMAANFLKSFRRLFIDLLRTPQTKFHGLRIIRIVGNPKVKCRRGFLRSGCDSEAGTPTRRRRKNQRFRKCPPWWGDSDSKGTLSDMLAKIWALPLFFWLGWL